MLRFDLAEVIRTPGMRQVYEVNEPPYEDDDVEFVSPVTGRITATNTGTMLLVRGPIETTIAEQCSRCLTDIRVPIHTDLEENFELKEIEGPARHEKSVQVVEEDEIGSVFDGKVLQLGVLIRQAALLAAPLQPLCREACPGIAAQPSPEAEDAEFHNSPFRDLARYLNDPNTEQ